MIHNASRMARVMPVVRCLIISVVVVDLRLYEMLYRILMIRAVIYHRKTFFMKR